MNPTLASLKLLNDVHLSGIVRINHLLCDLSQDNAVMFMSDEFGKGYSSL